MGILKKTATAIDVFKKGGFTGIANKIEQKKRLAALKRSERQWLAKNGIINETELESLRHQIAHFARQPLISILLPVYNVDGKWLRKCINSVLVQIYENWELCIADDKSPEPHIRRVLDEYVSLDPRIKVFYRPENGHISAASNSALEMATGEFSILLDHDDELSVDALFWVAKEILDEPATAMIYSDEDMMDDQDRRFAFKFKPDFSRDLLYSLNLVTHLSAYKTDILRAIGGFRIGIEGSQDYDLALRFIDQIDERQIRHIPRILYHWRAIAGSVALSGDEKPYAHERARTAIRDHFERTGVKAVVEQTHFNLHRVRYALPENMPTVSLILANHSVENGSSVRQKWLSSTLYENIEIIFTESSGNRAADLNQAAAKAKGEILCFSDERILPESEEWLTELVGFAIQPQIGAVGGKVVSYLDHVIGGGIVLGGEQLCSIAHSSYHCEEPGNFGRNRVIGNYSAVSASCFVIRTGLFREVNGFEATGLQNAFFDADLCLRLGLLGLRIVHNPCVELKQSSKNPDLVEPEPTEAERRYFSAKWKSEIAKDRFYNPNFSDADGRFDLKI